MNALAEPRPLEIATEDGGNVSYLLQVPQNARARFVFAHGAGAGMTPRAHQKHKQGNADFSIVPYAGPRLLIDRDRPLVHLRRSRRTLSTHFDKSHILDRER